MPRQCQFPVQCSDNRRCYRASSTAGFVISLALVAVLAGYVGVSHACAGDRVCGTRYASDQLINSR